MELLRKDMSTEKSKPLVGDELLKKIEELKDSAKADVVHACGYVVQKEDGSECLDFASYFKAILAAKGMDLN